MTLPLRDRLSLWPGGLGALRQAAGVPVSTWQLFVGGQSASAKTMAKVAGAIAAADVHVPGTTADALPLLLAELRDLSTLHAAWHAEHGKAAQKRS